MNMPVRPIIHSACNLGCEFLLEKFSVRRGTRDIVGPFKNLMLDSGLNRMGSGSWATYIAVGTGNLPPNVLQTNLQSPVAVVSLSTNETASTGVTAEDPFYSISSISTFPAGTFNNVNLQEIAVGWGGFGSFLAANRTLIKDALGNPVSLNVQSDEFLRVTVKFKVYPNLSDVLTTMNLLDRNNDVQSVHDVIIRPARANNAVLTFSGSISIPYGVNINNNGIDIYNGNIGTINQSPSGTSVNGGGGYTQGLNAYVNNSNQRGIYYEAGLNSTNGSIRSVYVRTSLGAYQVQYDPPIVKDANKVLRLEYLVGWGRVS